MTAPKANWLPTPIEGVLTRAVAFNSDGRGAFGELWRESWTAGLGLHFTQANLSLSDAGVLRGLHFHERQTDLWVVLEGRALVALVDLRPMLSGGDLVQPPSQTIELTSGDTVVIPTGVAHGFLALEPVRLLYLVTNEYDGTDEHGFAWSDPLAALGWPTDEPTLSERDAAAPSLTEALRSMRER
ncbi:MAG TPA: dTDP-4-dehydrorhamnose 3,5-epimerase family protein [Candidatus Limnocylindrales bacterium]|nr:dTDP-4-dehydrorhamnose 3,5-epimerase family protein [Candidatus Limnocylindrales bacterium]